MRGYSHRFRSRLARRGALLTFSAALGLVLSFALLPVPAAGAAPNATVIGSGSPPYTGATAFTHHFVQNVGCRTGVSYSLSRHPTFNLNTGLARFELGVQMFPCSAAGSSSTHAVHAVYDGVGGLSLIVPTNGTYHIETNWTVAGSFDYNVSYNGSTPNGSIAAYGYTGHQICVIDRTSPGPRDCVGWNVDSFVATNGTGVFSIGWSENTTSRGWKLLAGHQYELESFLTCSITILDFNGVHSGSANAQLNFASKGYGGTMQFYRLTR
jgi:hypothetical protein